MLKADFLGLTTLTVISDTIAAAKANHNFAINLDEIYQCHDPKPFRLLGEGLTDGIFQLESAGMTAFMRDLQPRDINEIIAGVSLYRPGPMAMIPQYLQNRRNPDGIVYDFDALQPILEDTYGIIIYQEQAMRIVMALAGYQRHHSDDFRKAISKKKPELIAQHRQWFIEGRAADPDKKIDAIPGGLARGYPRAKLEALYDKLESFGSYAFCLSHGAAYGVIAYATAWLKHYFPTEFMAALLNSVVKNKAQVARYINHCRNELGIMIHTPDINTGINVFVARPDKSIEYSLAAKNTEQDTLIKICAERQANGSYRSFYDFLVRCAYIIDKKNLEALLAIGAFDSIGVSRARTLAALEDIMDRLNKAKAAVKRYWDSQQGERPRRNREEVTIAGRLGNIDELLPPIDDFPKAVRLRLEKEYLGVYLTSHPLYDYMFSIENAGTIRAADMAYDVDQESGVPLISPHVTDGKNVQIIAIITHIRPLLTKKKREPMAMVTLEDLTGNCGLLVFPQTYAAFKDVMQTNEVYSISGQIKLSPDEPPVIVAEKIEPIEATIHNRVIIRLQSEREAPELLKEIKESLAFGQDPVYVEYNNMRLLLNRSHWVNSEIFPRVCSQRTRQALRIEKW